jgi:N-acetylglucosamine malate deacetylase 2
VMLSFGPDGLSGHPDHIAIGQWAREAFQRDQNVSALYTLAVPKSLATELGMAQIHAIPDESITLAVNVSKAWEVKLAAIHCHRTQLAESPILVAPLDKQRLFLGREFFIQAQSRQENDFFMTTFLSDEDNNL